MTKWFNSSISISKQLFCEWRWRNSGHSLQHHFNPVRFIHFFLGHCNTSILSFPGLLLCLISWSCCVTQFQPRHMATLLTLEHFGMQRTSLTAPCQKKRKNLNNHSSSMMFKWRVFFLIFCNPHIWTLFSSITETLFQTSTFSTIFRCELIFCHQNDSFESSL